MVELSSDKWGKNAGLTKVDSNVANVRACERDKLPLVTGVSHDLLITSEGRVEDNLADLSSLGAERETGPNRPVLEHEPCILGLPRLACNKP